MVFKFIFLSKRIFYKNKTLLWISIYKMELIEVKWGKWERVDSGKEKAFLWLDYSIHSFIHLFTQSFIQHLLPLGDSPSRILQQTCSVSTSQCSHTTWKDFIKAFLCQPALDLGPWGQFKVMDSYMCCILHMVLVYKNIDLVRTKFNKFWPLTNK